MSDLYTYIEPGAGGGPEVAVPISLSTIDLLNLTNVGIRADSFVFELLDASHNLIGPLKVSLSSPPHVRNDTTRSVFRTCTGLTILDGNALGEDGIVLPVDPGYVPLGSIDPLRDRVRASMRLQNGDQLSMGVFMFGDDTRGQFSWGTQATPELFDETFLVDQPLDQTYGIAPGQSILTLVNELVGQCGLASVDFSAVQDAFASSAVSFAAGSSRNQAIIALVALLGCYPPFFDNNGTYTTRLAPSGTSGPDHIYGSDSHVIAGTPSTTNSIYRAPNRYQVIGSDPSGAFVGEYDLPDSAPNSYANTGRRVVTSTTMPGIPSSDVANLAAYINALTDRNSYVQASFSSTADPRHDTFETVSLYGVLLQEVSWEIVCAAGGQMDHSLVGFFPNSP